MFLNLKCLAYTHWKFFTKHEIENEIAIAQIKNTRITFWKILACMLVRTSIYCRSTSINFNNNRLRPGDDSFTDRSMSSLVCWLLHCYSNRWFSSTGDVGPYESWRSGFRGLHATLGLCTLSLRLFQFSRWREDRMRARPGTRTPCKSIFRFQRESGSNLFNSLEVEVCNASLIRS